MIQPKMMITLLCLVVNSYAFSQPGDLTPEGQAYKDSITALNLENEAVANSQEAYNKGIELFSSKKFAAAIQEFNKSIEFDPNFTAAYYNKGIAENESEKYNDATKTFTQLIVLKPTYSKAFFQRGRSYQGLNDYLNAEKDYETSIKLDNENPKDYYNYGTLRFLQNDFDLDYTFEKDQLYLDYRVRLMDLESLGKDFFLN